MTTKSVIKFLCAGITCVIFFASCNKKDLIKQAVTASNSYALSTLSASPAFAVPLSASTEHRDFSIILKDGSTLAFSLDGTPATIFGTRRTLTGTVNIGGVKEHSIMVIGTNGFGLYYLHNQHVFALKNTMENIDLGAKDITVDVEDAASKAAFATYAQENGVAKANELIAACKTYKAQAAAVTDHTYDVVVERTSNYTLEDQTLTEEQWQKNETTHSGNNDVMPAPGNDFLKENVSKRVEGSPFFFTLEVAYGTINTDQYIWLCLSFISIDPSMNYLWWSAKLTQFNPGPSIVDKANLLFALVHGDGNTQIERFYNYNVKFNKLVPAGTVRVAFYTEPWSAFRGQAYFGTFSTNDASVMPLAIVCTSGKGHKAGLAHECGHCLGSLHALYPYDLMYPTPGDNLFHFDADNLQRMRAKFGF